MEMSTSTDASTSAIGYLYQCRRALLSGILLCKTHPGLDLSLEKFDDVAFEKEASPVELIQTKHHAQAGNLGDMSVDLWKTLGLWSERAKADPEIVLNIRFSLITTATAPPGSAAELLREGRADSQIDKALALLEAAAKSSANVSTEKHRKAFLMLPSHLRVKLMGSVFVYDNEPNITDVRAEIEDQCWSAAPSEHIKTFVDYLEGWWFSSVILILSGNNSDVIPVQRIRAKIDELREAFKLGSLPLDENQLSMIEINLPSEDNRTFVQQLKLLSLPESIISLSIRDYYRSSEQRSRWARENLLLDGESERYDAELADRWLRIFSARIDESSPLSTNAEKIKCGKSIFHWANNVQIPFRNRGELWLSAGSYQILADQVRVGWHPDFKSLLQTAEPLEEK